MLTKIGGRVELTSTRIQFDRRGLGYNTLRGALVAELFGFCLGHEAQAASVGWRQAGNERGFF